MACKCSAHSLLAGIKETSMVNYIFKFKKSLYPVEMRLESKMRIRLYLDIEYKLGIFCDKLIEVFYNISILKDKKK